MHTIRLTPLEEDTGTRLDSFLSRRVEGLTRSAAARLLAEGCVTCDGAVPGKSYRIAGANTKNQLLRMDNATGSTYKYRRLRSRRPSRRISRWTWSTRTRTSSW